MNDSHALTLIIGVLIGLVLSVLTMIIDEKEKEKAIKKYRKEVKE